VGPALRLAFVTDIITPYVTAQLEALSELAELKAVFCSDGGTRAMPWDLAGALSFEHQVIGGLTLRGHSGDGTDYHLNPRILSAIAQSRPDAVIAAGYSLPTLYASIYCAARRRPLVIYSEGTSRSERRLGRAQGIARSVLLRRASCCAAISRPAAERFRELGVDPERIFLAPYSTNLAPMWRVAETRDYRPGETLRVVCVGRLIARKGFDRLLRATAAAVASGAAIELRIVGSGPEEGSLKRLTADLGIGGSVTFAGFADQARLPEVYADADAFAFPTLRDPFGIVLLEAAAAGLPLIASPHAGATQDLVRHERNGLVVDPDDPGALSDALMRLAREPALRERLGRAASESTRDRTPQAAARGYMDAVNAALRQPGRAIA
jgi:glycosyltransferase involved in cell wall biosynthesis